MRLKSAVETGLARFVEQNPYLWKVSWEIVKRVPVLLPHDKSYNAFRHFVKAVPQGLFLDVGANDGITALGFRKFSTSYRILSLEPNPLLEPGLAKVKRSDPLFNYRLVGAGDKPASMVLYMPVYRGIALHTYTSGSLEKSKSTLRHICGNYVAEAAEIKEFSVNIVTVDFLAVDPSIVKIDVEGFDYEVLLGAVETIERNRVPLSPLNWPGPGARSSRRSSTSAPTTSCLTMSDAIDSDAITPADNPASATALRSPGSDSHRSRCHVRPRLHAESMPGGCPRRPTAWRKRTPRRQTPISWHRRSIVFRSRPVSTLASPGGMMQA